MKGEHFQGDMGGPVRPTRQNFPKAAGLDSRAISESLDKHVAAFGRTLTWGLLVAAVVGLGALPGSEDENKVKIFGVAMDKAAAYSVSLAIYTMVYLMFTAHALTISHLAHLVDEKNTTRAITRLLVVPGVVNPLAFLGSGFGGMLLSSLSFGIPFIAWWLMYVTTLGLESAAGARSILRCFFLFAGLTTAWGFAYCCLVISRKLKDTQSPLLRRWQRLRWGKFAAAVVCFWCGAWLYHLFRGTTVQSLWYYSDIAIGYPVCYSVPWWLELKRGWLVLLGILASVCCVAAWCTGSPLTVTLVLAAASLALPVAAIRWLWRRPAA
ncbi:MAG: hypothetical protein JSU94_12170 [Phycisphaerales bacterium]|nr:MAG: hypothetical protein JSU94_12170 [Phycisphaerales bacterium]